MVALCIEGKPCSSEELSRRMADFGVAGQNAADLPHRRQRGTQRGLKKLADWRLSMSPHDLPHHLARVMLLEQIYRAYQISAGNKIYK